MLEGSVSCSFYFLFFYQIEMFPVNVIKDKVKTKNSSLSSVLPSQPLPPKETIINS